MNNQIRYLQKLFYDILNDYGKVFMVVKYSDKTRIGARGFSDEEKHKGMILVFNQRNNNNLVWAEDGSIQTVLGFGANNKPEKCFIHADDVVSIFSHDAKIKLDRWDTLDLQDAGGKSDDLSQSRDKGAEVSKIVSLDRFRKSKD